MLPKWLVEYAEEVISKHGFDASHDMTHFMNTYNYTKDIYNSLPSKKIFSNIADEDGLNIICHAAFCHDLIDDKYVDSNKAIIDLKNVFLKNNYNKKHLKIIIELIDNISFSKERKGAIKVSPYYRLALDIISDADKLDAYRPERVVFFQERKSNDIETTKGWIKTILVKRVLEYKDKWLKTDYAKQIAIKMHEEVEKFVEENLKDATMFPY